MLLFNQSLSFLDTEHKLISPVLFYFATFTFPKYYEFIFNK